MELFSSDFLWISGIWECNAIDFFVALSCIQQIRWIHLFSLISMWWLSWYSLGIQFPQLTFHVFLFFCIFWVDFTYQWTSMWWAPGMCQALSRALLPRLLLPCLEDEVVGIPSLADALRTEVWRPEGISPCPKYT